MVGSTPITIGEEEGIPPAPPPIDEEVEEAAESVRCRISLSNSTHKCCGAVARSSTSCCTWVVIREVVVVVVFLHVSKKRWYWIKKASLASLRMGCWCSGVGIG